MTNVRTKNDKKVNVLLCAKYIRQETGVKLMENDFLLHLSGRKKKYND